VNGRPDHYDVLGVSRNASTKAIKAAYRRRMRELHPDTARTTVDTETIAAVARAWNVLSDPKKRTEYDADREVSTHVEARPRPVHFDVAPARFPWRFVLTLIVIGTAAILIVAAFTEPTEPGGPDNLLQSGSCVNIGRDGAASEVRCDGPHDAIVQSLVAFDAVCPSDTESHLDRQGMGRACVVRADASVTSGG
jgi:molecular chaperone DnaJ